VSSSRNNAAHGKETRLSEQELIALALELSDITDAL
jgi:hypothetical protein